MERDEKNITFAHSVETLFSERGLRFQREKYLPKIEFLERYFAERFEGIRVLDVGVGYGVFLHLLEREHGLAQLYGMDPFPDSIEIARRYTSARIAEGNILDERWPVEQGFFDVVTCFDVVEHLDRPGVFFERVPAYLRAGGLVVVTTPNRGLPYRMRSLPLIGIHDTNPTHVNVREPRFWRALAERYGFELLAVWKGEHLTHVRVIPRVLAAACSLFGVDHRRIPVISAFEQSLCMVLRVGAAPPP